MDLIALGECLVEFTRREDGSWRAGFAGDAVNVLVHAARLGRRCGFISSIGNDLFRSLIDMSLVREGIDMSHVRRDDERRNGLYFIENDPHGESTFHFWRDGSAATRTLVDGNLESVSLYASTGQFLFVSGVTLAVIRDIDRIVELLAAVTRTGTRVVLDTNYRRALWDSPSVYEQRIDNVLRYTSIFLPSMSDIHHVWTERNVVDLCGEWNALGVETIVIKNGAEGVLHYDNGEMRGIPPLPDIKVVDTTGAGDAFNAGFLSATIDGASIRDAIDLGQHTAAKTLAVRGAIP